MMKRTLTAVALATVLAAPAFAQTATPPAASPSSMPPQSTTSSPSSASGATFVQNQQATDWRGSKLIGATVYGSDNSSIGEVNDLVLASDGKVSGVVIGVGGFLGVGEKNVAVPFEKLNVTRKADSAAIDKITVSFTKDELKNAPTFAYYEPASTSTTGANTTERPRGTAPMGGTTPSAPAR